MAAEPGVRGVEWPLRAERERIDSVTGGEEYNGEGFEPKVKRRCIIKSLYFNCHRKYFNSNFGDFKQEIRTILTTSTSSNAEILGF